jgi:hypothetical protein
VTNAAAQISHRLAGGLAEPRDPDPPATEPRLAAARPAERKKEVI